MARIRSVKPALRTSRVVAQWPREVRYAWVLLWGYLDDTGRGLDAPRTIAGDCFPYDDDITPSKMDRWLSLMSKTKVSNDKEPPLCRYEVAGVRYLHAVNWGEHQKPNRPKPSTLPPCPVHDGLTDGFTESSSDEGSDAALQTQVLEGGRWGEGELGGGEALHALGTDAASPAVVALGPPPPRTCANHPNGTEKPCRACQRARLAAEAWETAAEQARRDDEAALKDAAKRVLADARNAPQCPHGQPGGLTLHPKTSEPLCPSCRRAARNQP